MKWWVLPKLESWDMAVVKVCWPSIEGVLELLPSETLSFFLFCFFFLGGLFFFLGILSF